jgi:hypothetical protein
VVDTEDDGTARLYVAYLGGALTPGRMGEDHEVVFVVATSLAGARSAAKAKWQGRGRAHIDAVAVLDEVDGHRVRLDPTDEPRDDGVVVDATYVPASRTRRGS